MHWDCQEWGKQRLGRELQDCTKLFQDCQLSYSWKGPRGLGFMEQRGALLGSMHYFCPAWWGPPSPHPLLAPSSQCTC